MASQQHIAVLISGPLRTLINTWPLNKKILQELNCELKVFFHTWDKDFATKKEFQNGATLEYIYGKLFPVKFESQKINIDEHIKQLPHDWIVQVDNYENFIQMMESRLGSKRSEINLTALNSLSMFYGMDQVARLAVSDKNQFDSFIRLRSDFLLPQNFSLSKKNKIKMHGHTVILGRSELTDICFSGLFSKHLGAMLGLENMIKTIVLTGWISPKFNRGRTAEIWHYENLEFHGLLDEIEVTKFYRKGTVVRNKLVRDHEKSFRVFHEEVYRHNKLRFRRNMTKKRKKLAIYLFSLKNKFL